MLVTVDDALDVAVEVDGCDVTVLVAVLETVV